MANRRMGPPSHQTCHFNFQLLMANGGVSSSTLHMSLQLFNCQWPIGVGPGHHICHLNFQLPMGDGGPLPHPTYHFNSQLPMANGGGSSSTLHMSPQLSTADGQWGRVGPPPHCTCHFSSQLLMANGWVGPPPHHICRFNSQLPMANEQCGVVSSTFHIQSKSHHPGEGLPISPTKLNAPRQ